MQRMIFASAALCAAFFAVAAQAGAWTQEKGNAQVIVTGLYSSADRFYDTNGRSQSQSTYRKFEINPYMEYGLTERITLGANLSLQRASQGTQSNWGIGDSEFFARYRVAKINGFVFSLQPLVKLPSPESSDERPALGGRHPDAEMGVSVGRGFELFGQQHFANLDAGYRHRFGSPNDQWKLAATAGFSLNPQWMLLPQFFMTRRVDAPAGAAFTQSSGDDYNQHKLQFSVVYRLDERWSLQAGAFTELKGRNIGDANGAIVSVWQNF